MGKCMTCGKPLLERNTICDECKALNKEKKNFHVDLNGYTALVTGARIRIGYATALRLLRDGATVIALTRFPYDALERYSKETDFNTFKENLIIYGFDLRRIDKIDILLYYLYNNFDGLDILINNAAQTIKKSQNFYAEAMKNENYLKQIYEAKETDKIVLNDTIEYNNFQMLAPIQNTQISYQDESPTYNSWVAKADEISPEEFLEVQIVNVTAPFMLISRLKELMKRSTKKNKFIINVSSVEGKFNIKNKPSRHVHTNMAKSSLNMMTHSLSMEYSKDRIFMYSVDPGWVSNQFPSDYEVSKNFKSYLSFDDGAARICDPIYSGFMKDKINDAGHFIKDFKKIDF